LIRRRARRRAQTSPGGYRRDPTVQRLYDKAKRLGTWNPADVDLAQDRSDWGRLGADVRRLLLRATAVFSVGEEAVSRDLLPYASLVARGRLLDDELFVTAWLWEEGKHTDFFLRFLADVHPGEDDLGPLLTVSNRRIFEHELPQAMAALDGSPETLVRALVTYCLIVEGLMAETGHAVFAHLLTADGSMPGLRKGLALVRRDESRHVAYGMYALFRALRPHPDLAGIARLQAQRLVDVLESSETLVSDPSAPLGSVVAYQKALDRLDRRLRRIERSTDEAAWPMPRA
jgi:ribonucleoside-diphosphate reductase beta chain